MLDKWILPMLKPVLNKIAKQLHSYSIQADHVSITGFLFGLLCIPLLGSQLYTLALIAIIINRICDGLDGELARFQGATDKGAYLDIVLDFIFYAGVVVGFAWSNPTENAMAAVWLLWGFMGTGSSFLAFAIMAERRNLQKLHYPAKGFYYLGGIAEGTETIVFLVLMCLLPTHFTTLAMLFFVICVITTFTRIIGGYHTLKSQLNA